MMLSYRPIPRRNKLQAPHSVPARCSEFGPKRMILPARDCSVGSRRVSSIRKKGLQDVLQIDRGDIE